VDERFQVAGFSTSQLVEKQSGKSSREWLQTAMPFHPVTRSLALPAGKIDGKNQARGVQVAPSDLPITVTARELGCSVGTANLRDFKPVPGLTVVQF